MFNMINEMIAIEVQCPICKKVSIIEVPVDGFIDWQGGELIQDAFPTLSADIREQLISGICPKCWEKMF